MAEVDRGAPLPVQAGLGGVLATGGLFFALALADEAGVGKSIWVMLLLATVGGVALAWLNEWVEGGRSPRALSLPVVLMLGTGGAVLGGSLAEDNQVWIGLAAHAAGIAWFGVAIWRIAAASRGDGSATSD